MYLAEGRRRHPIVWGGGYLTRALFCPSVPPHYPALNFVQLVSGFHVASAHSIGTLSAIIAGDSPIFWDQFLFDFPQHGKFGRRKILFPRSA